MQSSIEVMNKKKRVIGLLLAQIDDAYQIDIWRSIKREVEQRGNALITFIGQRLGAPSPSEHAQNWAYRLSGRSQLDGLIVVSSALSPFLEPRAIEEFIRGSGLPSVSVGYRFDTVPSICVDGRGGTRTLIKHLIEDHGRTRFAFIGGPPTHPEAMERKQVFLETLAEAGLEARPELVFRGNFLGEAGERAARAMLAGSTPFDAVVCVNDRMAIAAMGELAKAGLRIPEDVSIAGFDDIVDCRELLLPLSTVRQPLAELGQQAVEMLDDVLEGQTVEHRLLACTPVIRQSCGCTPAPRSDLHPLDEAASNLARFDFDVLDQAFTSGDETAFLDAIERTLRKTYREVDPLVFHRVLNSAPVERKGSNFRLVEMAHEAIGDFRSRLQALRRMEAEQWNETVRLLSSRLGAVFDVSRMVEHLQTGLRELGIGSAFVFLFEGEEVDPLDREARLIFALRHHARESEENHPIRSQRDVFRVCAEIEPHWIFVPLVHQDTVLGFAIFAGTAPDPLIYSALRDQISSTVMGARMHQQILDHEKTLEQEIEIQTRSLKQSNLRLKNEAERRRRLEHEVREITDITTQRIGQDLHDDLCQHLAGVAMMTKALRNQLPEGQQGLSNAFNEIVELISASVSRAKKIAQGLYPSSLDDQGFVNALAELVASYEEFQNKPIRFEASREDWLLTPNTALQLYRIAQEAVSNSVKHSGAATISVRVFEAPDSGPEDIGDLILEIEDNGSGLPERILKPGMGMRIMQYRANSVHAQLDFIPMRPGLKVRCAVPLAKEVGNAE